MHLIASEQYCCYITTILYLLITSINPYIYFSIGIPFGLYICIVNYWHSCKLWMIMRKKEINDHYIFQFIIQFIINPIGSLLKGISYGIFFPIMLPMFLYNAYDYYYWHKLSYYHKCELICIHSFNNHVYLHYSSSDYYRYNYNNFIVFN